MPSTSPAEPARRRALLPLWAAVPVAALAGWLMDLAYPSVGAWILAGFIQQTGYGWQAVGAYNAGARPDRATRRSSYALAVWRYYGVLRQQREQLARQTP